MQEWEYKVEWLGSSVWSSEKMLNNAGEDGWELVGIYKEDDGSWNAVFKRPQ